jgi:hypothetical protein
MILLKDFVRFWQIEFFDKELQLLYKLGKTLINLNELKVSINLINLINNDKIDNLLNTLKLIDY